MMRSMWEMAMSGSPTSVGAEIVDMWHAGLITMV